MTPADALRRILGLLGLSRGASPEARSARRQALRLARKHGITPFDVARARRAERVRTRQTAVSATPLVAAWEMRAALSMGTAVGCAVTVSPAGVRYAGPGATAARDFVEDVIARVHRWLADGGGPQGLLDALESRAVARAFPPDVALDAFLFGVVDTIAARIARRREAVLGPPTAGAAATASPTDAPTANTQVQPIPPEELERLRRWEADARRRLAAAEQAAALLLSDPFVQGYALSAVRPLEPAARRAEADVEALRGVEPSPASTYLLEGAR